MRYPSIKTLLKVAEDRDQAKELRAILDGTRDLGQYSSVRRLDTESQSHNSQPRYLRKLTACNEVLQGFGVEFAEHEGDQERMLAREPVKGAEHVNMGDTYANTIVYVNGRYRVCSIGDIIEKW